jgi:hypothetical protein
VNKQEKRSETLLQRSIRFDLERVIFEDKV